MKHIIKRIIAIVCAGILFIGCEEGFKYILVNDTSSYTRLMMHELYNSEKNIDILFLGSSHTYRSLVPQITDKIFGAYTFNGGTSSQALDGSLAILKEAAAYNDVSQVYLELYYGMASGEAYKERSQMTKTYIISDYMKPSLRKVKYLLDASSKEHYVNSFIPVRRNWEKIFDYEYITKLIAKKQTDSYKNYEWVKTDGQTEYYVDRGFVANDDLVDEGVYWNSEAYGEILAVSDLADDCDWRVSLQKIIDFCKKNEIELTLFMVPMPEWTLVGKGNYDAYSKMIQQIADENEIGYYDFNLCKSKYFPTNERTYFKDEDHLNTKGAEAFSKIFSEFFTGKIVAEDLFYDSFADKLASEEPIVYGVAGPKEDMDKKVNYAQIISNRSDGIEYQIIATTEEGKQRTIQNFSENKLFTLPQEEHGTLDIIWRLTNANEEQIQCIEVAY